MKTFLATILIICLPSLVQAQVVSGFSGEFTHGTSMTIVGSGFGTKDQAAPGIWDDVESGDFHDDWGITGTMSVGTEARHAHSSYCGTNNFQGSGGDGKHGYFTGGPLGENYYGQYWFKMDENFDWGDASYGNLGANLANVKIFRMWNPSSSIDENFVMATRGYAGSSVQYFAEHVENPQGGYFENIYDWTKGEWHLFQFQYKESSMGGNDGEIRVWRDGALVLEDLDIMTRDDYSELKRPYILGFYNSWGDAGTDQDDFYIDDAYVDNSWARVEVGNNPVYNSCTHREIQIPSSWSAASVTVNVNAGSFGPDDELYLFVVNEQGDISSGFPMDVSIEVPGIPGTPVRH